MRPAGGEIPKHPNESAVAPNTPRAFSTVSPLTMGAPQPIVRFWITLGIGSDGQEFGQGIWLGANGDTSTAEPGIALLGHKGRGTRVKCESGYHDGFKNSHGT